MTEGAGKLQDQSIQRSESNPPAAVDELPSRVRSSRRELVVTSFVSIFSVLLGAVIAVVGSYVATVQTNQTNRDNQRLQLEAQLQKDQRDKRSEAYNSFFAAANKYQTRWYVANLDCTQKYPESDKDSDRAWSACMIAADRAESFGLEEVRRARVDVHVFGSPRAGEVGDLVMNELVANVRVTAPRIPVTYFYDSPGYKQLLQLMCQEIPAIPRPNC